MLLLSDGNKYDTRMTLFNYYSKDNYLDIRNKTACCGCKNK